MFGFKKDDEVELYSVIKNDRPSNEIVWKCAKEDFYNHTQLIVMESEEALFVKDGVIVETFSGGKYDLCTENYPFITSLRKLASGGENAFNCRIYFVDKAHKLEMLWGTDSPIQIRDAQYGFAVGVRTRGSYSVQIGDSKKFLIKLVGNINLFTEEDIKSQFRTVFQTKIKVAIATVMKQSNLTILDMNTELENIGKMVEDQLAEVLDEYGIRLVNFYVSDISIPETDPNYRTINEAYARAHAGKIELDVQGDSWNKLTAKELAKDMVNNEGTGEFSTIGAGLGMGIASAGLFDKVMGQVFSPLIHQNNSQRAGVDEKITDQLFSPVSHPENNQNNAPASNGNANVNTTSAETNRKTTKCPKCGNEVPEGNKFCGNCGAKIEEYHCKNCGEKLPAGSKFCGNCGTRREDNDE